MRWRTEILALAAWGLLRVATAEAAFEIVGGGARSLALGHASAAASGVADAVWHNPAANARAETFLVGVTHARLYPGLEEALALSAVEFSMPLASGSLQAGYSDFGFSDWRERVLLLGYGRNAHERVGLGAMLRSEGWDAGALSHRGWRIDLGGTYEVGWVTRAAYVRLAAVLENIGGVNMAAGQQASGDTPRRLVLGASVSGDWHSLLADLDHDAEETAVRFGYEARTPSVSNTDLRVGGMLRLDEWRLVELDAGLGYGADGWRLDYAFSYPLQLTGLGGTHWISLGYERR